MSDLVLWLDQLRLADLPQVGGKNSSLGEMIGNLAKLGVSVPGGFATTAHAFRQFVAQSQLNERVYARLATLDADDVEALARCGEEIRRWVVETPLTRDLEQAIRDAYAKLCKDAGGTDIAVAVRSPRPPRTCPTRRSRASRKPSSTSPAPTTSCTR
jgi:pyruvate,water dikinase